MTASDPAEGLHLAIGGARLAAIVRRFYACVPMDPILGPMYPDGDWAGAQHRLQSFLVYRLGGPADYLSERGHPRLRMRHAPFAIGSAARDRWVELMAAAVAESVATDGLPPELAETLMAFLADIATFLINRAD